MDCVKFVEDLEIKMSHMSDEESEEFLVEELKKLDNEDLKSVCELLDLEIVEDEVEEECECSEYNLDEIEYYSGKIALEEEAERCIRFKGEFATSQDTKESKMYKEAKVEMETFIAMTRMVINDGAIDYNNGLAFVSNYFNHKHNVELAKYNAVQVQQQQV